MTMVQTVSKKIDAAFKNTKFIFKLRQRKINLLSYISIKVCYLITLNEWAEIKCSVIWDLFLHMMSTF